jgi:hypothetical protein
MPAARMTLRTARNRFEPAPAANAGAVSIRPNNPFGSNRPGGKSHALTANAGHRRIPQKLYATLLGSFDKPLVQQRSPQSQAWTIRKVCGYFPAILDK